MQSIQSYNLKKEQSSIRFVCVADTHTKQELIPLVKGDVLIHAGDFTFTGLPQEVADFNDFLKQAPYEVKIVIAGNHEITFDIENYKKTLHQARHKDLNINPEQTKALLKDCIYLEDSSFNLNGINIYGSPYIPAFYENWGFMLDLEGDALQKKWEQIPSDTDILITHNP